MVVGISTRLPHWATTELRQLGSLGMTRNPVTLASIIALGQLTFDDRGVRR